MTDIQFDEEPQYQPAYQRPEQKSFLIRLVFATGLASTDRQAEQVLLGIAVFVAILAFAIPMFVGNSGSGSSNHLSPEQVQKIMYPTGQPTP